MSQLWHLTLLGELRVQRGEQVITRFKYQKVGGLLAYLAFHPRQMHSREILIEMFWPESPPDAARNNLSTALSSLRNQLEPPGTPAGTVIRADRYSVGVNPDAMRTDVHEFEQTVRHAETTSSTTLRQQHLEAAVALYHGRLLPGYYEEWILPEQERLEGVFFDMVSLLLQQLEQQGDLPTALRYARQAVSVDPLREEAHQHLMRLLAVTGQPGAALRQFKELERLLEAELGEEPSAPLRALYRQIEKQSGLTTPLLPQTTPATYTVVPSAPSIAQLPYPTTFTFLMTDLAAPLQQVETEKASFRNSQERHHQALTRVFTRFGGQVWKQSESGFLVAFSGAKQALSCAAAVQQALIEQNGPDDNETLRVRMALHTGDVEQTGEGGWQGEALHRTSRILTAGHGGQILLSEATAGLVRRDLPEDIWLSDRGVYRLRDVPTPERLYEAHYPGRPTEFPPLATEAGYPSSLPVQVTRFFGREQEIAQIMDRLQSGKTRLLTLTGAGGTGKTRLAIEVAGRMAETYQGAIWFVELAKLMEAGLIASTILSALGVSRSPQQEPLEQVIAFLLQQPSLLVLDNFEHLVEEGAVLVQNLLTRVPSLTLLITSRQVLGLSGEQVFAVTPLPTPNGNEGVEQLSLFDSVRLFVDRAQAVKPEFQVTSYNAPAIAELCQRLEGIPLAIELAAARVEVLPPFQLLSQLSDRFKLLTTRRRDVSARHRTLEAAIDWSYQLLSPELQRFFSRLSVFRGGWTTEAAEAVCEEPLALDYLAQLRDHSLVLSEETENSVRFRMLETVREFAQDCLRKAANETGILKRHAEFFVQLAERAKPELRGPEQVVWLRRLDKEYDNLRAALAWCLSGSEVSESPSPTSLGLRFTKSLAIYWQSRGYLSEGRNWLARLLERKAERPTEELQWGQLEAGNMASMQGDFDTAKACYHASLEIARQRQDTTGIFKALNNLGNVAADQGDYTAARTFYEESLEIRRTLGDQKDISRSLNNLGLLMHEMGDAGAAIPLLQESLAINRELQDSAGVAGTLNNLGLITFYSQDYPAARVYYEEALQLFRELGNIRGISMACSNLANILKDEGNFSGARALYTEGMAACLTQGDKLGIAQDLAGFAFLAVLEEQMERAARLFGAAHRLREEIGAQERPVPEREGYETDVARARERLGETAYASAWEAGRTMSQEEAVAYALG